MEQQAIERELDRLKLRYGLFQELLPTLDYPAFKTLLKHDMLTDYERDIYQAIQEINYYIDQHKLTEQRLNANEQVGDLTADEIENMLDSDDVETSKMVKVSMLNNVEDELLALLD